MKKLLFAIVIIAISATIYITFSHSTPVPVKDDPLVRMPGTQQDDGVNLEGPHRCLNCHGRYNKEIEPAFNWQGSMMAQAGRDFLFWSCMVVAGQDSMWATGTPNAMDLCERCHFPEGWLENRSDPPNVSAMFGTDFDGVHCDMCHRMYDPFFKDTADGTREGQNWEGYWDESNKSDTPSKEAAQKTLAADSLESKHAKLFNGNSFFVNEKPHSDNYKENGAGQYFVSRGFEKRSSFADAKELHDILYSRYNKSKYHCSTCHDVSNPVLLNLDQKEATKNDGSTILPSEDKSAFSYFHVERTFSEFMLSAYGREGGAEGSGHFSPSTFKTSQDGNLIASCQDCHMPDATGRGASSINSNIRPNQSKEHPKSGQPIHDLTGGNMWVGNILASTVKESPNFDQKNHDLLSQGKDALTLDLNQGTKLNPEALLAATKRAKKQLEIAASFKDVSYNSENGNLNFKLVNHTGHKLISGFPEGRRMFLNIKAYDNSEKLLYEINPYDYEVATLKGLGNKYSPKSPQTSDAETYLNELVYETNPKSELTGEEKTFHFALATGRFKDNRIPPKGFDIEKAKTRLSEPVWQGKIDKNYFTAEEYAGGYDDINISIVPNAKKIEISLYYQTTSREYIEFLRDEIEGKENLTLPKDAYVIQTDQFFVNLKAWGKTIFELWNHNKNKDGAKPVLMTRSIYE